MNTCKLVILDEVNCKFIGLPPEIRKYFYNKNKIFNPANRFIPSVRMGRWDGCEYYFNMGGSSYINLLAPMLDYLHEKHYKIEIEDLRTYNRDFTFDNIDNNFLSKHLWPVGHRLAGQPIILQEHQTYIINRFLSNLQSIISSPTGSGKSLISAVLSKKVEKYGRSIVIVPNKDLISQTEKYYIDLKMDVGVYFGDRKDFFKTHTICTWQSLAKLMNSPIDIGLNEPITFEKFINNVVAVIVDEAHGIKASLLTHLLCGPLAKIPIRWAITGTVPKDLYDAINLTISIGDVIYKLPTAELQAKGLLSTCDVKIIQMIDTRAFSSYTDELNYLVTDKGRLQFIANMIIEAAKSGNVLALVGRKETGRELEKLIPNSIFLSGVTKSKDRKVEYDKVKLANHKIIIATSGIAAVGIDVPRVFNLFLIECGKSFVRTIQSCGRALRIANDKNHATIWDICSTCKFSKRHLTNRKAYYKEQEFPYSIQKVNWQQ
jgi:superfamily II DNA or RNA helicase